MAERQERKDQIRLSFVQRLTVHGKRVDIGLGSPRWGATTLSEARARAMSNYRIARNGGDPRAAKRQVPAFADGIEAVLAIQREAWRDGGKSEKQWRSSLATYARPLMDKPLDAIGPGDVLAVLVPIWSAKRETARRVKQRIGAIMKWAIAEGHRESNPVDAIGAALPKNANHRTHFKALPHERVGSALATVRASGAWWATKAALEFLVLSASRSGEVRGMVWSEVDLDARTWTVPASRMKANRDHVVPLPDRALAVLAEAREHADGSGLVFPSVTGRAMSDSTLSKLVKELGIEGTPHGMRSAFRDWAAECTSFPREVAEEALAHVNPNRVEAAYRRSTLEAKRRELLQRWSAYLNRDSGAAGEVNIETQVRPMAHQRCLCAPQPVRVRRASTKCEGTFPRPVYARRWSSGALRSPG